MGFFLWWLQQFRKAQPCSQYHFQYKKNLLSRNRSYYRSTQCNIYAKYISKSRKNFALNPSGKNWDFFHPVKILAFITTYRLRHMENVLKVMMNDADSLCLRQQGTSQTWTRQPRFTVIERVRWNHKRKSLPMLHYSKKSKVLDVTASSLITTSQTGQLSCDLY